MFNGHSSNHRMIAMQDDGIEDLLGTLKSAVVTPGGVCLLTSRHGVVLQRASGGDVFLEAEADPEAVEQLWQGLEQPYAFSDGSVACRWGDGVAIWAADRRVESLEQWVSQGGLSPEAGAFLRTLIQLRRNIVVVGSERQTTAMTLALMEQAQSAAWLAPSLPYGPGGFSLVRSIRDLDCARATLAGLWVGEAKALQVLRAGLCDESAVGGTHAVVGLAGSSARAGLALMAEGWGTCDASESSTVGSVFEIFDVVVTFAPGEGSVVSEIGEICCAHLGSGVTVAPLFCRGESSESNDLVMCGCPTFLSSIRAFGDADLAGAFEGVVGSLRPSFEDPQEMSVPSSRGPMTTGIPVRLRRTNVSPSGTVARGREADEERDEMGGVDSSQAWREEEIMPGWELELENPAGLQVEDEFTDEDFSDEVVEALLQAAEEKTGELDDTGATPPAETLGSDPTMSRADARALLMTTFGLEPPSLPELQEPIGREKTEDDVP